MKAFGKIGSTNIYGVMASNIMYCIKLWHLCFILVDTNAIAMPWITSPVKPTTLGSDEERLINMYNFSRNSLMCKNLERLGDEIRFTAGSRVD